jgi:glycerol uptake facilitator-like aquaporin
MKTYAAEAFGTFWLVLGGCGSALLAAAFPSLGIGFLGVSIAFGLTLLTMAFAIGHISGCHINPAVSIGLWAGGRFPKERLLPYIVAQIVGGIVAGGVLYVIASGKAGFDLADGFASNGYGVHSPGGYSMTAALVTEIVMTAGFLFVIPRFNRRPGTQWLRIHPDRSRSRFDPPGQHPGNQYLGEPCPQHRCRGVRRRMGTRAVVALLGGADRRGGPGCLHLQVRRERERLIQIKSRFKTDPIVQD